MNQKLWIAGLVLMMVCAGLAVWWLTPASNQATGQAAPLTAFESAAQTHSPATAAVEAVTLPIQQQQVAVAQVVAANPLLVMPNDLRVRPDFISAVEWAMLQGAANDTPQPQEELRRLVNSLRFHKMREHWQALLAQPLHDVAQRQALANQLLIELPTQAIQMGWPESDVRGLQEQLVHDVVPSAAAREARLQHERQRLHEAKQ